jgi:hypothetical protein
MSDNDSDKDNSQDALIDDLMKMLSNAAPAASSSRTRSPARS